MHHTLKLYSSRRKWLLRAYIYLASWTRVPLLGRLVRRVANGWGHNVSNAVLLTLEEAEAIIDRAGGLAVTACSCREVFNNCDHPRETEILIGSARRAFLETIPEDCHEISTAEAKEIMRECHLRGLLHTVIRCRDNYYAVCNCCPCCCVPWRLSRKYDIGEALQRHPDIVHEVVGEDSTVPVG